LDRDRLPVRTPVHRHFVTGSSANFLYHLRPVVSRRFLVSPSRSGSVVLPTLSPHGETRRSTNKKDNIQLTADTTFLQCPVRSKQHWAGWSGTCSVQSALVAGTKSSEAMASSA
ncbi:hypothetical protein E4U11_008470, partial [Claviceps purpurea]